MAKESLGKTFKEAASEYWLTIADSGEVGPAEKRGIEMFAAHLDGFNFLTPQLQIIALMQSRKIDAELINALVDAVGVEKATEIARQIHAKYTVPKK